MVGLCHTVKKSLRIRLLVSVQYTNVTYRRTNTTQRRRTRYAQRHAAKTGNAHRPMFSPIQSNLLIFRQVS